MYKIRKAHIYSILLLALLLHLTILNYIKIFDAKPDLLIMLVIFFGLFLGRRVGFESGLVAGFLEDIFTVDIFWVNTFILGVTGLLAGVLNTKFFKESKRTQFFLVFFLTLFSMTVHFLSNYLFIRALKINFSDYFIRSVLPTSIYTASISIPVFSKLVDLYGLKEEDEDLL